MILPIHIAIALASLVATTYLAFSPSRAKFYASYILIGLTLVTGTYLIISLHVPMLKTCMTGLAYLAVAIAGVVVGYRRFATAKQLDR
jgi:NADH:ubiquinone oxidoreductase subunit 4 (subunit M)